MQVCASQRQAGECTLNFSHSAVTKDLSEASGVPHDQSPRNRSDVLKAADVAGRSAEVKSRIRTRMSDCPLFSFLR